MQESSEVCLIHLNTMGAEEAAKYNCDLKSSDCSEGLLSARRKGKEKLCQYQAFSLLIS